MWNKQAGYGYMMACFDGRIGKRNVLSKSLDICVHLFALKTSMSPDVAECWNISNRLYWYDLLLYHGLRDNATTVYDSLCFKQSFTPVSLRAGCRLALQRDPATGLGKVGCPREFHPCFLDGFGSGRWNPIAWQHGYRTSWDSMARLGWGSQRLRAGKKCATEELTVIGLFSIYFVPTLIALYSIRIFQTHSTTRNLEFKILMIDDSIFG